MSDERNHLPSASAFQRLDNCPGSHLLAIALRDAGKIPAETRSIDSDAGTAGHLLLEHWARDPAMFDQPEEMWSKPALAIYHRLAESMRTTFWMATAQATRLMRDHNIPYRSADAVEQRLWLREDQRELGSAKIDCLWMTDDVVLIIDWKTLFGDHDDADVNLQMRMQAACVMQAYEVPVILVAVVQPRTGAPTVAQYSKVLQQRAHDYCCTVAEEAMKLNAARAPGPWCKFCPCLPFCPEAAAVTQMIADYGILQAPIEELVSGAKSERLSRLMHAGAIATKVVEAVKNELRRRLEAGEEIEGPDGKFWQIGKGKTLKPVEDPQLLWTHAIAEVPDLSAGDMMSVVDVSKGAFEAMLRPKAGLEGRINAGAWKDLIAKVYEGCLGEKTTQGSLELVERPKTIEE